MLTRVNHLYIGKDVARTAAIVDGADMDTVQANIVEGELAVLDKDYKNISGASATYANTDKIYIVEGSNEVFETTYPDGTVLNGRRLLISPAIDGARVTNYSGDAYTAKAEATADIPAIADTIVAGTEYVLRVLYLGDVSFQVPGQITETYRYIAKSGDTSSDVYDALVKQINKRSTTQIKKGRLNLVQATNNAGTLELVAKPILSCTTSVNDIDEFVMNDFKVFLNYVDNDGFWTPVTLSSDITRTGSVRGTGTWELVRDTEKHAQSYEGIMNRTWFPIITPAMRVVKDETYNMLIIEHDTKFRTPDNQYNKEVSHTTELALATTGTANAEVLATLNTWMASTPAAWANVSF